MDYFSLRKTEKIYTYLSIQQENHQNNILRFRKLSHYGFKWRAFYKSVVLPASIMRKLAKLALNCPKLSSKVITRLLTTTSIPVNSKTGSTQESWGFFNFFYLILKLSRKWGKSAKQCCTIIIMPKYELRQKWV